VKVRIGFGIGAAAELFSEQHGLARVVDALEDGGWDSLWFPERVNSPQLDPVVAMAYVAGRSRRLKFGPAVQVVPGRNPVLLAKALASLDVVSDGRCLPALGLGVAEAAEHQAFGVKRQERAAWFDEAFGLMRRLWSEDSVDHRGPRFSVSAAEVLPKPVQNPFEVWMGGAAPSELRRTGRLADGWLASLTTPAHVAAGIAAVSDAAEACGRKIDPEHYGVMIPVADGELPEALVRRVSARRPDARPHEVVACSTAALAEMIDAYLEVGASKFVVFPVGDPGGSQQWIEKIETLAEALLHRQT